MLVITVAIPGSPCIMLQAPDSPPAVAAAAVPVVAPITATTITTSAIVRFMLNLVADADTDHFPRFLGGTPQGFGPVWTTRGHRLMAAGTELRLAV